MTLTEEEFAFVKQQAFENATNLLDLRDQNKTSSLKSLLKKSFIRGYLLAKEGKTITKPGGKSE